MQADRETGIPFPFDRNWALPDAVQMACLLEVSAPKAGNVHSTNSFDDMHFGHFAASAVAVRSCFCDLQSVGSLVLSAVEATRQAVGRNTNLGTLLLFGPIAMATAIGSDCELRDSVELVLAGLTKEDSRCVYEAICHAKAGGMGIRERNDLGGEPPDDLLAAMQQVADTDAVARQYTNGFSDLFDVLVPWFEEELVNGIDLSDAICRLQVRWLAHEPDGLIVRKVGVKIAAEARNLAQEVSGQLGSLVGRVVELDSFRRLDSFLRADGNRRNPGTTADLIAATLLVELIVADRSAGRCAARGLKAI